VAKAKPANNVSTQATRTTCRLAAPRDAHWPATVLIRPLLPAASVRIPRIPFVYGKVTLARKSTRPIRARQSQLSTH
jgi:hypothetical protein